MKSREYSVNGTCKKKEKRKDTGMQPKIGKRVENNRMSVI